MKGRIDNQSVSFLVMEDLRNGCTKCHGKSLTEHINGGIMQETHYKDGHIVKEITTYTLYFPDAYTQCDSCHKKFKE